MGRVKRGVHIKITHRKASFPVSYFYVHLSGFARRTHFRARPCCMLCIQMALISRTRPCCMLCIQMARTSLILYYPSFPVSYFYVHLSGFARRTHFRARPCCMLCIQMALISRTRPCCMLCIQMARTSLILLSHSLLP